MAEVCRWLRIKQSVYDNEDKNIMDRAIQYIKDRLMLRLMITFHALMITVDREHVKNWFRSLMLSYLNVKIDLSKFIIILMNGG